MKHSRGFTALELMIGVMILGLVLAASLPAFRSIHEGYRHRASVSQITSRMFRTRQMAVREKTPYVVNLDVPNSWYWIYRDDDENGVFDAGETTLGPYVMEEGVGLQNVNWINGRLTFFANGSASRTSDLRVVDGKGRSKTIRISSISGNTEVLP
jgi:prepilin-type N-terminal cleavage/methylation domain-containing protein